MLAGAPITWKSKKQSTVALSSTEAEYIFLSDATKEVLWLFQFLESIDVKFQSPEDLFEDNEG